MTRPPTFRVRGIDRVSTVVFDEELGIEAYHFEGIMQRFPNHFHEYYVIGFIESGRRRLDCRNEVYEIGAGDLIFFNPLDNHACESIDQETLDYRCLNIKPEMMQKVSGKDSLPSFTSPVVYKGEQAHILRRLHQMIMEKTAGFEKEEMFYFLIQQLIEEYAVSMEDREPDVTKVEVEKVCTYIQAHYAEQLTLDELAGTVEMNKYSLLRAFTRMRGITPYRYLQTIRINEAKKLLEQGVKPLDAAMATGFVDQSHFSKFFMEFIGLTPGQYRATFTRKEK